jgi:hypothetical protein
MATDIEAIRGEMGSGAAESEAAATLESIAISSTADAFAASSAQRFKASIMKTADAAVAIILALNLIVASETALRDYQKYRRRINSTHIVASKQRIAGNRQRPP